jgi:hypothetical protein
MGGQEVAQGLEGHALDTKATFIVSTATNHSDEVIRQWNLTTAYVAGRIGARGGEIYVRRPYWSLCGSVKAEDPGEVPLAISAASNNALAFCRKKSRSSSVLALSARTMHSPTYSPYSFAEDMTHPPGTNSDDSQNTEGGFRFRRCWKRRVPAEVMRNE